MSTNEVFVQHFTRLFDHYQQVLTLGGEEYTDAQLVAWNSLPPDERNRLMAAARLAMMEMEINPRMEDESRKYYAKPGEAEWGC